MIAARWIGADRLVHNGAVPVSEPLTAGQPVTVWVDRANLVVDEPTSAADAYVLASTPACWSPSPQRGCCS
jgi:hypothetical protein